MIVAGFGFRKNATVSSLEQALNFASQDMQVDLLATVQDKAQSPVFRDLVRRVNRAVVPVDPVALSAQQTVTQSKASLTARQVGSVAEASALAAAGPGAYLLVTRVSSDDGRATCALAKGEGL